MSRPRTVARLLALSAFVLFAFGASGGCGDGKYQLCDTACSTTDGADECKDGTYCGDPNLTGSATCVPNACKDCLPGQRCSWESNSCASPACK
jgi:hypothetical protein